jgi:hypothetical protein
MKKILFLSISFFVILTAVRSQTVLFQDDFESYTAGSFLVQQAGNPWATWSNQPGGAEDALVSTAQAHSPTKSVHLNNASDDLILKLGNKTSGKYAIEFYYFIPTGFGGYFNLQHFEAPGVEWAIEVYFGNNGVGQTSVNSVLLNFSHAMDAWIKVETIVDLDLDSAWLYINNTQIRDWKFSMQSNAPTGTKQLGAVNFYCGALTGQTPQFYFDDVKYTQIVTGTNPPQISLSTTNIVTDGTSNEIFTISNLGDDQMSFIAYPIYPDGSKAYIPDSSPVTTENAKLIIGEPLITPVSGAFTKSDKNLELSYVNGMLASGLGYGSTVTVRSAVKFDYNFVKNYIGRELISVTIGVNDLPAGVTKVQIYDRGSFSTPGAGMLLAEKPFSVTVPLSQALIVLDNPIYLDGKDIWIGWECTATGGTYPLGMDEGPKVPGVNWTSTGPGWTELGPTIDNNLFIMGSLQGSSIYQWLSVSPQIGVVNGGGQQTITASFNITGMASGNYMAKIVIGCNDQTAEYSEVEVNLSIGVSMNENEESVAIVTFPNPVSEIFNINANTRLQKVEVYSITGQIVKSFSPSNQSFSFSVADLNNGIYTVVIYTGSEKFERKIVVE